MSGSMTPARRSRNEYEDDVDEEEDEISVDGEEPRQSVRKRARLDEEDQDEDEGVEGGGVDEEGDNEPSSVCVARSTALVRTKHDCSHRTALCCQTATDAVPRAKAQRAPVARTSLALSYVSSSRTSSPTPTRSSILDQI